SLDQLRPGSEVIAMDGLHLGGLREVERVEGFAEADALLIQHGAHRAVGEEGAAGQSIQEWRGNERLNLSGRWGAFKTARCAHLASRPTPRGRSFRLATVFPPPHRCYIPFP